MPGSRPKNPFDFKELEKSLAFLYQQGIRVIVALDFQNAQTIKTLWKEKDGTSHIHIGLQNCTISNQTLWDTFFSLIQTAQDNHQKVAVHCAAGKGRTGMMLAGYILKEAIDQSQPDFNNTERSVTVKSFDFTDQTTPVTYQVTPSVWLAVQQVRLIHDHDAVEFTNQWEALNKLHDVLLARKSESSIAV